MTSEPTPPRPRPLMPSLSSSVRFARPSDLDAVAMLAVALGRQHAGYDPHRFALEHFAPPASVAGTYRDFFAEQLERPDAAVLVAEGADDRAVGYAFVRLEEASFLDLCPPSGWLHDLYLDPAARGRGLGTQLLDAALAHLRNLGASTLMLSASPRNDGARRLFAARGFAPTMIEYTLAPNAP